MKNRSKLLFILSLLVVATAVVLLGCQPQVAPTSTVETVVQTVVVTQIVEVEGEQVVVTEIVEVEVDRPTPTPEPINRNGAWLDTIVVVEEPSIDAAIARLSVGDIDLYNNTISNPAQFGKVKEDAALTYSESYGGLRELTFNPAGPEFADGRLNPFSVPAIREAMNWLIDRNYVAQESYGGLAYPKFVPINAASADAANLAPQIAAIASRYAYNPERAEQVITAEMEKLGAVKNADGLWTYNDEVVNIIGLIRPEDERALYGEYFAAQLESVGFQVERQLKRAADASPCWLNGTPSDGCFHWYTGGWVATSLERDAGGNFAFYYTPQQFPVPLFQAYTPTEEFDALALRLATNDFLDLDERTTLFAQALDMALVDSIRIWVVDTVSFTPRRAEVEVASDLSGAVYGTRLWPFTLRRTGEVGGSMTVAMPSILTEAWNPIAGSNWIFDASLYRAIGDAGVYFDPYTGLAIPSRVERAEVTVQTGLPVGVTYDWVTLDFADTIEVPADAWVDWDATTQEFIPAGEGVTALQKGVVYYPADLFSTVTWHDGSPISLGDFVINMITTFDLGKPESAYFDEAQVPLLEAFLAGFKAVRIVSTDPLVIETYTDNYGLDAENNITTWWPAYTYGEAPWQAIALGLRADGNGTATFSTVKADALGVDQLNYIAGPTLDILNTELAGTEETPGGALAENFIPYAPTLGQYVTADEAAARYANIQEFFRRRGHFWVGTGPFFLQRAFPVEGTVILERNQAYPDSVEKWAGFSVPPLPEVLVDGSDRVTIGTEAVYDVFVDFQGEPYPAEDIKQVIYLLFDATGNLVSTGEATASGDGLYQVTLSAETTGALAAGTNRLQVVVVSKRVALPSTSEIQFVTE